MPSDDVNEIVEEVEEPKRSLLGTHVYAHGVLDERLQAAYQAYYDAISAYSTPNLGSVPKLAGDELAVVLDAIEADHPELFWQRDWRKRYRERSGGQESHLFADAEIEAFEREKQLIEEKTASILEGVAGLESPYETVKHLFEHLVRSTDYKKGVRHNQDIRSVLIHGISVCSGYAAALQYLLLHVGIPCFKVVGDLKYHAERHAWNYVFVDGVWCAVDVTWGDKNFQGQEGWQKWLPPAVVADYVDYDYLCMTREEAEGERTPEKFLACPSCDTDALDYYAHESLEFSRKDPAKLAEVLFPLIAAERSFVRVRVPQGKTQEYKQWFLENFTGVLKAHVLSRGNAKAVTEQYIAQAKAEVDFEALEEAGMLKAIVVGFDREKTGTFLVCVKPSDARSVSGIDLSSADMDSKDFNDRTSLDYYREHHYLLLGAEESPQVLTLPSALEVLDRLGYDRNNLTQARKAKPVLPEDGYDPNVPGAHYCDFCGRQLTGIEYDALHDGRLRCVPCSKQILRSVDQFKSVHQETLAQYCSWFQVTLNVPMTVSVVNARKMARVSGAGNGGGRVLGLAVNSGKGKKIYLENGSPKAAIISTLSHELTHIWQYLNWDRKDIIEQYGPYSELIVYEGMAVWAQIQYMKLINELDFAERLLVRSLQREDAYGEGLRLFYRKYGFSEGAIIDKPTPFGAGKNPLG